MILWLSWSAVVTDYIASVEWNLVICLSVSCPCDLYETCPSFKVLHNSIIHSCIPLSCTTVGHNRLSWTIWKHHHGRYHMLERISEIKTFSPLDQSSWSPRSVTTLQAGDSVTAAATHGRGSWFSMAWRRRDEAQRTITLRGWYHCNTRMMIWVW